MSGGVENLDRKPTLHELAVEIGYFTGQARQWAAHPDLGPQIAEQVAMLRAQTPEATALYDARKEAGRVSMASNEGVSAEEMVFANMDPETYRAYCMMHQLDAVDALVRTVQGPADQQLVY